MKWTRQRRHLGIGKEVQTSLHIEKRPECLLITTVQNVTRLNLWPAASHDVPPPAPLLWRSTWQVAHRARSLWPAAKAEHIDRVRVARVGGVSLPTSRALQGESCEWLTESGRVGGEGGGGWKEKRRQCWDPEMSLQRNHFVWKTFLVDGFAQVFLRLALLLLPCEVEAEAFTENSTLAAVLRPWIISCRLKFLFPTVWRIWINCETLTKMTWEIIFILFFF